MKKARMNISHSRFILSKLKIFGEIVTTNLIMDYCIALLLKRTILLHVVSHLTVIVTS